ncbi:MAG: cytochrome b5 domain-containing protein [Candidatus Doudnabacteria bacterium]|jgi:cytochrome b involved in lipid metabolism
MIWFKEKFNKEIKALPSLMGKEDVLTATELQNIRQKVLLSLNAETNVARSRYSWSERKEKIMRYVISVLVGLSLFGGTAFASTSAKPGDLLYPVKRITEKVQMSVTASEQSKAQLQAKFAEERLKELAELKSLSGTATSTTATSTSRGQGEDGDKIEVEAKVHTQTDVNNAIEVLKQVQAKLVAKGNAEAAATLGENIIRLQNGAQSQNLKLNFESENHDRGEREGNRSNSTSTQGSVKVKIEDDGKVEIKIKSEKKDNNDNQGEREDEEGDNNDDDNNNGKPVVTPPPVITTTTPPVVSVKSYTLAEVQAANTSSKCWSIVSGNVYDLTSWISQHPGGQSAIISMCGKDATSAFLGQHGGQARPASELAGFKIGILK